MERHFPRFCEEQGTFIQRQNDLNSLFPGLVMVANIFMLVLFYLVLVVPILWCLQPSKPVTPF